MKIFIAKNPPQAHIISDLLRAENIEVEVRGEGLFGLQGELPMDSSTQPYVWLLNPAQRMLAEKLIAGYERDFTAQSQQEWKCDNCGELNEGQFALCWQCGTATNPYPS